MSAQITTTVTITNEMIERGAQELADLDYTPSCPLSSMRPHEADKYRLRARRCLEGALDPKERGSIS